MFKAFFTSTPKRGWWPVALAGIASFAMSFGALNFFAAEWAAAVTLAISELGLNVILAMVVAQFVMSLTHVLLTRNLRRENEQMHTAIDSMAQGLCMFDASERLVVCNPQYYKLYELAPDDVRRGTTLTEVLTKRVAKGTFSRDLKEYRKEFLAEVANGRTITHEAFGSSHFQVGAKDWNRARAKHSIQRTNLPNQQAEHVTARPMLQNVI